MKSLKDKIKDNIEFWCGDDVSTKNKDLLLACIMDNLRITFEDLIEGR